MTIPLPRKRKSQGYNGLNTLAYVGQNTAYAPDTNVYDRDPTIDDHGLAINDLWVNTLALKAFILARREIGNNLWLQIGQGQDFLDHLLDDAGTSIQPDANGAIKIAGGELINTTSAASIVTVNLDRGTDGQIPIAATGGATVYANITPGTNIDIANAANATTVSLVDTYQKVVDPLTLEIGTVDSTQKLGSISVTALENLMIGTALPWTPTLSFGGGSTGIIYNIADGTYQVMGNLVFYTGSIKLTSKGTDVGTARIGGLPLNAVSPAGRQMGSIAVSAITLTAGYTYLWVMNEVTTKNLLIEVGGSGANQYNLTDTGFANNSELTVNGFYFRE
jgi:hypothetical protein